ncbi:MAG: hypothetical protein ACRD0O_00720 [Acidimicrobiia bacterium]
MTLIEDRVRPHELDAIVEGPTVAATAAEAPLTASAGRRLSGRWALVLAGAWVTIFTLGVAVEPASTGEENLPLVGAALATVLMGSWAVMASGLIQKLRYGAVASAVGAGTLLAMTVGCPLSGHHAGIGAWWGVQLVGALTLLAVSRAALRSGPPLRWSRSTPT